APPGFRPVPARDRWRDRRGARRGRRRDPPSARGRGARAVTAPAPSFKSQPVSSFLARCPRCGTALAPPTGLCPACALNAALGAGLDDTPTMTAAPDERRLAGAPRLSAGQIFGPY